MTDILKDMLYINGKDIWTEFGAWLAEDKEGETKNYSELQKIPATKSHVAVNFRERDGEKLPDKLFRKWEARDISLKFAIAADNAADYWSKRNAFVSFLKNGADGWLTMEVPELGSTYRVYYKECSDYEHLVDIGGKLAARFTVKLREPEPQL
ncbi:MAG: phage tail family protein [Roseburia sp.]|nr:phage tail family protein [Roseburia sp.]